MRNQSKSAGSLGDATQADIRPLVRDQADAAQPLASLHPMVMTTHDFLNGSPEHRTSPKTARVRAGRLLALLRRRHIPCSIDSFSTGGWTARLGDPANGFYAQQGNFRTLDAAADWLLEEVKRQYAGAMAGGD